MASKEKSQPPKLTPAQARKKIEALENSVEKLKNSAWCYMCDTIKSKDKFYTNTDPRAKSGLTPICRDCAREIAMRVDKNGDEHRPTEDSVKLALEYLNKPFINLLWEASIQEAENSVNSRIRRNPWTSYIKNVALNSYNGMTFKDSDMFKEKIVYDDEKTAEELSEVEQMMETHMDQDTYTDFLKNKKDVIRLLSYDPFEQEPLADQPFLYSQLLGLLDSSEEANDDMMRTASAISIVRGFLQQSKIDDSIAKSMSDIGMVQKNSATIKSLMGSKRDVTNVIKDLAAESCISLKNSKNAKKGENTWTGKLRKLKDLNLRDANINGFDIDTCKGMQQVANISMQAILDTLHLDESEYSEMVAEQRVKLTALNQKAKALEEASRILLKENLDLRDTLEEHDLLNKEILIDLDDLLNTYIAPTDDSEGGNHEN